MAQRKKPTRRGPTMESSGGGDKPATRYPRYRKPKRMSRFKRIALRTCLYGGAIGALALAGVYYTLPDINDLNKFTKAPSVLIKSEDGQIIGSFGDVYGDYVSFKEMPQSLIDAVIATEDRNFYHHYGVDPFGLARAAYANMRAHHVVQGGSTITQQVAKNVFLTPERSFLRKLREMLLALKLEHRFSKQEILSIYLNRVYLGAGSYGVDAAAHRYFDVSARDLNLSESAIMAGLLKAPSKFAPTSNPALSRKRADQVLVNMADAGYLSEKQVARAREELIRSMKGRKKNTQSTFYFADWIADQLPDMVGNMSQDMTVITTLRPDWQAMAEKAVNDVMDKDGDAHDASQAALLAMTPDGAVRAMIGGRSYAESQYNRATQSLRQPGSSFKLFVYLAALEAGLTPDTEVDDHPLSIPVAGGHWSPKNYNGRFLGPIAMKEAVAESVNTVAVQIAMRVGLERVISVAQHLGITSDLEPLPSIALGSTEVSLLELTAAYAHLAAEGAVVDPYGIIEIDNAQGQPIYRRANGRAGQAISPGIVHEMNEMLLGVVDHGTGKAARIGRPAAGKTGTTSDYKDAWFMGYTPDLVTGVWVGNDDNTEMKKVTGGLLPAQIWHGFMIAALAGTPPHDIPIGGLFSGMPWHNDAASTDSYPQQPGAPVKRKGAELGHSFWDKLFGR